MESPSYYGLAAAPESSLATGIRNRAGRRMAPGGRQTTWFERHGSSPPEILPDWPEEYRPAGRGPYQVIEPTAIIALIEQPEYKRRWNTEPWE